jgi:hypothetical protein
VELVEADHRSQHPVDRPWSSPRLLLAQHGGPAGRLARPGRELADFHNTDRSPVQAALNQVAPEHLQIERVRLDRVRRALVVRQPRQVLVDLGNRPQVRADQRPRLESEARHHQPPHLQPLGGLNSADVDYVQDALNI